MKKPITIRARRRKPSASAPVSSLRAQFSGKSKRARRSPDVFFVRYFRTTPDFKPTVLLQAVPVRCIKSEKKLFWTKWPESDAVQVAEAYNRKAMANGFRVWAEVWCDLDLLDAVNAASKIESKAKRHWKGFSPFNVYGRHEVSTGTVSIHLDHLSDLDRVPFVQGKPIGKQLAKTVRKRCREIVAFLESLD